MVATVTARVEIQGEEHMSEHNADDGTPDPLPNCHHLCYAKNCPHPKLCGPTNAENAARGTILVEGVEYQLIRVGAVPPWMKPSAAFFYGDRSPGGLIQWEPGLSDDHTILYEVYRTHNERTGG